MIAALGFFTVPTLTFRVLSCFFVIEHGQRRILCFHTSVHPTSNWIVQQLREAFPFPSPYRSVILGRDAKFSQEVLQFLRSSGLKPIRTSIRSPWQNKVVERWVGSCRRELLDHVIPWSEAHLQRLGREYLTSYHEDRSHKGLAKETSVPRPIQFRPGEMAIAGPRPPDG